MIRLSDYVIDFLAEKGIRDVFLVSGGMIMYLLDSVGKNKRINYISNNHEQASTIGAESYARVKNAIGVSLVTSGPGSTNAITGVAGAWVDSIPTITISGQIKKELIANYSKMRQLGPQEINIIDIIRPITKYAITIMDPNNIKYELEKAFFYATSGRPGPVWVNIPLDIQGAMISEKRLRSFTPPKTNNKSKSKLYKQVKKTIELLSDSQRPVLIAGNGIRLSHGEKVFTRLIDTLKIPLLVHINGLDLIPYNHPYFMGQFGPSGYRRGNLVLQNSDFVLSIGASLNVASTGFNFEGFAPKAKKVMINIDKGEFTKPTIKIDLGIESDAKLFIEEFMKQIKNIRRSQTSKWLEICKLWIKKYPTIIEEFTKDEYHVNSYVFFDKLSDILSTQDILTTGIGLDVVSFYQAFRVKKNQRAFVNKNFGGMGWCIPAAIGTCVANNRNRVVCVTGDGSFQFNIQELSTISYYDLPIKLFVFNNKGYKTIRDTQTSLFDGRFVGSNETSGVKNPNFKLIASAYDLTYGYIKNNSEIAEKVKEALEVKGPTLYEVNVAFDQMRAPRASSYRRGDGKLESRPLEDMFPFLSREEFYENMHMFDKK